MFLFWGDAENTYTTMSMKVMTMKRKYMQKKKTAHSDEIVLTPEKAKAAGVEAEVVHPGAFREVIQAGGRFCRHKARRQR